MSDFEQNPFGDKFFGRFNGGPWAECVVTSPPAPVAPLEEESQTEPRSET